MVSLDERQIAKPLIELWTGNFDPALAVDFQLDKIHYRDLDYGLAPSDFHRISRDEGPYATYMEVGISDTYRLEGGQRETALHILQDIGYRWQQHQRNIGGKLSYQGKSKFTSATLGSSRFIAVIERMRLNAVRENRGRPFRPGRRMRHDP